MRNNLRPSTYNQKRVSFFAMDTYFGEWRDTASAWRLRRLVVVNLCTCPPCSNKGGNGGVARGATRCKMWKKCDKGINHFLEFGTRLQVFGQGKDWHLIIHFADDWILRGSYWNMRGAMRHGRALSRVASFRRLYAFREWKNWSATCLNS